MSGRLLLLAAMTAVLVVVAAGAAVPPLGRSTRTRRRSRLTRIGVPLATGVFLGTGLVHMLPDAAAGFRDAGFGYPWAFALCGATALALGALERLASDRGAAAPPLVAVAALSVHSFLAGAALGATLGEAALLVLFVALIAHKGAASFSLATLLARSPLARRSQVAAQVLFVAALPVGVALGQAATAERAALPLAVPVVLALGAGTFLHFGTAHRPAGHDAHGWATACGFVLMALIAIVG